MGPLPSPWLAPRLAGDDTEVVSNYAVPLFRHFVPPSPSRGEGRRTASAHSEEFVGMTVCAFRRLHKIVVIFETQLTSLAYVCMIIAVFFIRHLPVAKAQGIVPRIIAIAASNAQLAFFLLPRA